MRREEAEELEQVRQEAVQEGERRARRETARRMRQEGIVPEMIARVTGLRPQDFET